MLPCVQFNDYQASMLELEAAGELHSDFVAGPGVYYWTSPDGSMDTDLRVAKDTADVAALASHAAVMVGTAARAPRHCWPVTS